MDLEKIKVDGQKLRGLAARELQSLGVPADDAKFTADVLVTSHSRGVETHGIYALVPNYIKRLKEGKINPKPDIKITGNGSTASVDGDNGLGFVVGREAMNEAINRARKTGVGLVTVKHSNHLGPAFYYAMMALEHDMIGISMTSPEMCEVVIPDSDVTSVGTNPISVAAPAKNKAPFVLDMATSVVAAGKFRKAIIEGKSVPGGWAIDKDGNAITDPHKRIIGEGGLLPLGGSPLLGGYKGFGLGVVVEILCSFLSGEPAGLIGRRTTHFFGAINISSFISVDQFKELMDEMIEAFEVLPKHPGVEKIYVAGGLEDELSRDREANGVPLVPNVVQELKDTAKELNVEYDL